MRLKKRPTKIDRTWLRVPSGTLDPQAVTLTKVWKKYNAEMSQLKGELDKESETMTQLHRNKKGDMSNEPSPMQDIAYLKPAATQQSSGQKIPNKMKFSAFVQMTAFLGTCRIGERFGIHVEGTTVEERCRRDPTSIFAHPTECQLYYDCKVEIIDANLEVHMRECTYPQLYDDKKHECAPYNQVDCGSRTITKDVCDYRIDYCEGRCGDGCLTEFPSCKDKEDGQQEHTGKPRSQHYMVCRDERLMATGVSVEERCRQDSTLVFPHPNECQLYYDCKVGMTDDNLERHMRECKYPKLYDDKKHECVSYWDEDLDCGSRTIYKDVCDYRINYCKTANCNGDCRKELPSCKGMTDGKHKHSGYPDSEYFIVCKDGRLAVTAPHGKGHKCDTNELKKILTITALTIENHIEHRRTPSKLEVGPGAREE
ncbi:hypothetical protein FSP39_021132 [Pinctada imbricata]|uniref:Chitin-binding type-2 domain-containing protein n=1 Tax=Pinctada imbricata TaxID=66713 RepID=A0AA88XVP6_PINIB|nr:hypothetical protein FSP39_021132 [Pinctada imbricata]